jgi:FkbM family methyltransferase
MQLVHLSMPMAKVFVDIGTNRGFTSASWLALWEPDTGYAPMVIGTQEVQVHQVPVQKGGKFKAEIPTNWRILEASNERDELGRVAVNIPAGLSLNETFPITVIDCGMCDDCESGTKSLRTLAGQSRRLNPAGMKVFAFDGNEKLVASNRRLVKKFPLASAILTFGFFAFSDFVGEGTFEGEGEHGHLVSATRKTEGGPTSNTVPVMTVDGWMKQSGTSHIDVLKTDCEGHDPKVLWGASSALSAKSVTVVQFEYHSSDVWATTSLKSKWNSCLPCVLQAARMTPLSSRYH